MQHEDRLILMQREDTATADLAALLDKLHANEQVDDQTPTTDNLMAAKAAEAKALQVEFVNQLTGRDGHAHNN